MDASIESRPHVDGATMRSLTLRIFLLVLYIGSSLGTPLLLAAPVAAVDERDGEPNEWEQQVATDARGDVAMQWPGTIDLFYLTMGEVYTLTLGETYLFLRVGFNMTEDGDEDIENEGPTFPDPIPPFPQGVLPRSDPAIGLVVSWTVKDATGVERDQNVTLFQTSREQPWRSTQGQLIFEREEAGDHREMLFLSPLRRFGIVPGDIMDNITVLGLRDDKTTDTMHGFDVTGEDPWPFGDTLQAGENGIPYGIPKSDTLVDEARKLPDPNRPERVLEREPPAIDPERVLEHDPEETKAKREAHEVQSGLERIIVRWDKEIVEANFSSVGWVNFTVTSLFQETTQAVGLFATFDPTSRWLLGYGPGSEGGVQELPPQGSVNFSAIAAPFDFQSARAVRVLFIVLTDWGGFETIPITFINTDDPFFALGEDAPPTRFTSNLPSRLVVDFVNEDDPYRVNEPRKLLFRVTDHLGVPEPRFKQVRAFVHPIDGARPEEPYVMTQTPFMDGVYELPFTFHKPGAWVVDVYFYDYNPRADGTFPSIDFFVRIDYEPQVPAIVPLPLALGGVGGGIAALWVRERIVKSR